MKHFIADYRWYGRCNAFEHRIRIVTAESEHDALIMLEKKDNDIKKNEWGITEICWEDPHVENVLDIDWS